MTAFLTINAHPAAKGDAIDMDRLVNAQNLDGFRRLVFSSEAERKISNSVRLQRTMKAARCVAKQPEPSSSLSLNRQKAVPKSPLQRRKERMT
jgi:hypothetical protein